MLDQIIPLGLLCYGLAQAPAAKLPLSGLDPAKPVPGLCVVTYRISTTSPECQAFFDQGLGWFYSYAWMESARSFETAVRHDPDCAMAWWGLSRALEKWGKSQHTKALEKARDLLPRTSDRERLLITARLQEKGLAEGVAPSERNKKSSRTINDLLALYDDDEEGWWARAHLSEGGVAAVPYYKALLRINPLHPGANHELVHFYETYRRPALGWPYAEGYIASSPGIPHPFHMQAHLAMRLGRWEKTSDRSARAIELHREHFRRQGLKPADDAQYAHHLEILLISLIHDGRLREARKLVDEARGQGLKHETVWFRLYLADRAWDDAVAVAEGQRKGDKLTAAYMMALIALKRGDLARATAEIEVLQEAWRAKKSDRQLETRLWETQGRLMCQTGAAAGVKLLAKAAERSKNDYARHAWGHGAYDMEAWGTGALLVHDNAAAEEAFLEALAHDPGSVHAALGLQVLCERQGRVAEAQRYAELARQCWKKADSGRLETELAEMRGTLATARK
jgi:tetratricopeptide (TPR) repeat protein